jgi:phage shock protein A
VSRNVTGSAIIVMPAQSGVTPMFERLKNVINGMLNKTVSKMETPEILAQEAQDELESHVKKLEEALTDSIAQEKLLEQRMRKNADEVKAWEERAGKAVEQGNDELAKECLHKKQDVLQAAQSLDLQRTEQKKTTASLKQRYSEVDEKLQQFLRHKSTLTARTKAGEAVAKANDLIAGTSSSGMDKWEQKIREKEAMGDALRGVDGGADDDKFKKLDEAKLDDELAALKEKMSGPKLIVDKEEAGKHKEVVDENLPMVVKDITKPKDDKGNAPN